MNISNPCIITPRLLPGVRIDRSFISIEYGGISPDDRQEYIVHIDAGDFEYTFDDLRSGVGGGDLQSGLSAALGFLSAAAEAYRYGPRSVNYNLFPAHVMAWASTNADEISMLEIKIEETANVIEE